MRDVLPQKQTTSVTDIKKGLKDSLYGNGMIASSASPLISPAASGGSSSPAQDTNEGLNIKTRSDSPHVLLKNCDEKIMNSSNCLPALMPVPLTSIAIATTAASIVTSPISSPGMMPINRTKPSPKQNKSRRNQSSDMKQKNQILDFKNQNSTENYCANNNNNSKQMEKMNFSHRRKIEEQSRASRTPSTNSVSDELSSSGMTPTTDEQTNALTPEQNIDLNFEDDMMEAMKIIDKVESFPDASDDLSDFVTTGSLEYPTVFPSTTEPFMFENSPLRTTPTLDGAGILGGIQTSPTSNLKQSTVTTASATLAMQLSAASMASSVSSPTFQGDSKFSSSDSRKPQIGKSHLQEILGVTDTIRLESMSRPIDSVAYKSPTTTTSYSTGMKPHSTTPNIPSLPSAMAPPNRLPSNMSFNKPRQQFMFNEHPMYRPNSQGYNMDPGINGPWNRASPRHIPPNLIKQPFPAPSSISPTSITPMSQLQSTVDSIPAAPMGTEMGPPLRSPLAFETTASPGGMRMRPPPSPSFANDKRCVSADSVTANTPNASKKVGNKRERTRSADSREEDKKDASGPKNKRRKSKSKDDNSAKKESKTPTRAGTKGDKMPALSKLLDVPTNNPYLYIFSTELANDAASTVHSHKVPNIILFHQSFHGNCKLRPPQHTHISERLLISEPSSNIPMPTTSRSPTEMALDKTDPLTPKNVKTEISQSFPENIQAINLQDTKPKMLHPPDNHEQMVTMEMTSQPTPILASAFNGDQEELTAEKLRHREDKLGKLKRMQKLLLTENTGDGCGGVNHGPPRGGPGWPGPQPPMNYGPMGPHPHPHMDKVIRPAMTSEGMMMPGQSLTPENAEWFQLIQNPLNPVLRKQYHPSSQDHNAEKRRQMERGIPGELPSRPPPPYDIPQHRWMDPRMQMESMNPRLMHMVNHRPMMRMPQDPRMRGYAPHRMGVPRGSYPGGTNTRMPMYDQYMVQPGMRPPSMGSRLPPPGMRQPSGVENYPFSEQLMKQASYYNRSGVPYDPDPGPPISNDWVSSEGTQRLSHMPGAASPGMGPQGMMNPMEMDPRLTPGGTIPRGYDMGPSYQPDLGPHYDMMPCAMGSPTGPPDARMRVPPGSMMDAMARRGGQRPPDLDLNSQRSPMYQSQGPMPSPSVNPALGPRYPNPCDMGHPPQPSPIMHGCPRSPMGMVQSIGMGPGQQVVGPPQVMMPGGPHSAGPMSTPPPDWSGHNPNMAGTPTPNTSMMHHMMTSQSGIMTSQHGMMSSQPGMMPSQPGMRALPSGMMTSPGMMSQSGMVTSHPSQVMMNTRMPNPHHGVQSTKHPLSIMMNRINSFKMPERSSLYQDAVKDTGAVSPPPLTHQNEPPPLTHNTMPGGMRMPGHNHLMYDSRMGLPRMGTPQMNENFQQGYPGGHPSSMSNAQIQSSNMMMNFNPDSMPPPSDYQLRHGFPDIPHDFDLRGILPSEKPSQTISYLPPETNDQFSSPGGWGVDGIRPQLMPGSMYPPGPNSRPLI